MNPPPFRGWEVRFQCGKFTLTPFLTMAGFTRSVVEQIHPAPRRVAAGRAPTDRPEAHAGRKVPSR